MQRREFITLLGGAAVATMAGPEPANPKSEAALTRRRYSSAWWRSPFGISNLILVALVIGSLGIRLSVLGASYQHPDEKITLGVVGGVLEGRTLDTNWALYEVAQFKYPMYSFSSYYLTLAALAEPYRWVTGLVPELKLIRLGPHAGDVPLTYIGEIPFVGNTGVVPELKLIRLFSMFCGAAAIVAVFMIGQVIAGPVVGVLAALLTAASPQLFQDSLYGRPDAFFTLLFLLAIYISLRWISLAGLFLSSALMGFLVACKVTALLVVPLPLIILLLRQDRYDWSLLVWWFGTSGLGLFLGAFIGVPYGFAHPDIYWQGFILTERYYTRGGGPHGLREVALWERIVYLMQFLVPTVGAISLMLSLAGLAVLAQRRLWILVSIMVPCVATIGYMGTRGLFVERNFSHALPVLFLFAAIGIVWLASWWKWQLTRSFVVAGALIAASWPGGHVLWVMRFGILSGNYTARIEATRAEVQRTFPGITYTGWPNLVYGDTLPTLRTHVAQFKYPYIIEFIHYDDRFGESVLNTFLGDYRYSKVASVDSPFKHIAPSTMQAYLAASRLFYKIDGPAATFR